MRVRYWKLQTVAMQNCLTQTPQAAVTQGPSEICVQTSFSSLDWPSPKGIKQMTDMKFLRNDSWKYGWCGSWLPENSIRPNITQNHQIPTRLQHHLISVEFCPLAYQEHASLLLKLEMKCATFSTSPLSHPNPSHFAKPQTTLFSLRAI